MASGAPGSSPVCFGSVSSKPESTGDKAALARSVFPAQVPFTLSTFFVSDYSFSVCVKSDASCQQTRSLSILVSFKKMFVTVKWTTGVDHYSDVFQSFYLSAVL